MSPPEPPKPRPRWLRLRLTKALLVLSEQELLQALPADLLTRALRRGMRLRRWQRHQLPPPDPTEALFGPTPRRRRFLQGEPGAQDTPS